MLKHLIALLQSEYDDPGISEDGLVLLREGKYANSIVYRFETGGRQLVLKEFYSRSWLIRNTVGRVLTARETRALHSLSQVPGIPGDIRRIGPCALTMEFISGETIKFLCNSDQKLPKSFFIEFENRVKAMHRAGYVHLYLRNMGNIIRAADGTPYLIDFQTGFFVTWLPRGIRQFIEGVDLSGVYKNWIRLCEEELDHERQQFLDNFKGFRKFWIFDGYWPERKWRRLRNRFKNYFGSK